MGNSLRSLLLFLLKFLPLVLLGIGGGLWCKRVYTSILTGLGIGLLVLVAFSPVDYRGHVDLRGLWDPVVFGVVVGPVVLGSLVGHKMRARVPRRFLLTEILCIL